MWAWGPLDFRAVIAGSVFYLARVPISGLVPSCGGHRGRGGGRGSGWLVPVPGFCGCPVRGALATGRGPGGGRGWWYVLGAGDPGMSRPYVPSGRLAPALWSIGPAAVWPGGWPGREAGGWRGEMGGRGWVVQVRRPCPGVHRRSWPARAIQLNRGFDGQPPRGPGIFGFGMWHWRASGSPRRRRARGARLRGLRRGAGVRSATRRARPPRPGRPAATAGLPALRGYAPAVPAPGGWRRVPGVGDHVIPQGFDQVIPQVLAVFLF